MRRKRKQKDEFLAELAKYSHMHPPLSPRFVRMTQPPMRILYFLQRNDEATRVCRERILSEDGAPLRLLSFEPKRAECSCEILFLHGGGFVFDAAPHHFALARELSRALGARVTMPEYRLAPKHPFPAAPRDCLAAYRHLLSRANGRDIIVCGDSAGGNLAAGLCLSARSVGLPLPRAQMLLYPVLDRRMETESYRKYRNTPMRSGEDMEKYFEMYESDESDEKTAPRGTERVLLSPAQAEDVSDFPPTYIEAAQFDCLCDEAAAFAERLRGAGVPVQLFEIKGAMHGYDIARRAEFLKPIMKRRAEFLRGVFNQKTK